MSDEELAFITECDTIETALPKLFTGNVRLVIYTQGAGGACAFTQTTRADAHGHKVKAVDTTGAGDAFIGSFLYQLAAAGVEADTLCNLTTEQLKTYLEFSNCYCAKSVQQAGAIASYPTMAEMKSTKSILQ